MQKYSFLPFAAKVLRVVAWVILVVGVIASIVFGIMMGSATNGGIGGLAGGLAGFFIAVVGVIFSFLAWVSLLTARELLYLFMDVEENTRNTAERITKKSG
jgi:cytochrome bd-type quinol oxidase subunit 2